MNRAKSRNVSLWLIVENFVRQGLDDDLAFKYTAMCAEMKVEDFRAMVRFWTASHPSSITYS